MKVFSFFTRGALRTVFRLFTKLKNPFTYILFYFGYGQENKKTLLVSRTGNRFWVRNKTTDKWPILEVWLNHCYGDLSKKNYKTIVDIGGHIGMFSIYASEACPNAKIYSFEPFKENYDMFVKNTKNIKNIHVENVGILDKRGNFKIYLNKYPEKGMVNKERPTVYKNRFKESICYNIKTITLNDVFTKHNIKEVDFMKIDCEGSEYQILLNAEDALLKKIKNIAMEWHEFTGYTKYDLVKRLKKAGFDVTIRGTYLFAKQEA